MSARSQWFSATDAERLAAAYEDALERIASLVSGGAFDRSAVFEIAEDALGEKRQSAARSVS